MELLITVIGNAVLDPLFLKRLVEEPLKAIDEWDFHLTKGEINRLQEMFAGLSEEKRKQLTGKFSELGDILYANADKGPREPIILMCPTRRCTSAVYPCDPEIRKELRRRVEEEIAHLPVHEAA
jgi:hypothetical protein